MNTLETVSGHKGRDQWIRALAAASDLSAMAFRLALRLCVSFNCKSGQCNPGYRTLVKDMAVSKRSVFRAIAELEAGGWIAIDRTGGDNTRKNQFALLIPSAQVTTVGTRSGDNIMSPEDVSVQVTENGGSGDKNRVGQVTYSVSPLMNLNEPENLNSPALCTGRTTGVVDRESDNSTDRRGPRAVARTEPITTQQLKPSRDDPIGIPADGARAAFDDVIWAWPSDRTDDEGYEAYVAALAAAQGDTKVVLSAIWERLEESGADPPRLSDALRRIEHGLAVRQPQ